MLLLRRERPREVQPGNAGQNKQNIVKFEKRIVHLMGILREQHFSLEFVERNESIRFLVGYLFFGRLGRRLGCTLGPFCSAASRWRRRSFYATAAKNVATRLRHRLLLFPKEGINHFVHALSW